MFPCWGRPDTHPIKLPAAFCPDFPLSNEPCASHSKAVTISITVVTLQNQRLTQCCLVVSTKCCSRHIQKKAEKKKKSREDSVNLWSGEKGGNCVFYAEILFRFLPDFVFGQQLFFRLFLSFSFLCLFVCVLFSCLFFLHFWAGALKSKQHSCTN